MSKIDDIPEIMKSRIAVVSDLFTSLHLIADAMLDGSLDLDELKEVAAAMRPVSNMIMKKKAKAE